MFLSVYHVCALREHLNLVTVLGGSTVTAPFYSWGKGNAERVSDLPQVTQLQGQSRATNPGSLTPRPVLSTCPVPPSPGPYPSSRSAGGRREREVPSGQCVVP